MTRNQQTLRKSGKAARRNLSEFDRQRANRIITDRVIHAHWFQRAAFVGCYLSTRDEVNTWDIIARAWRMKKRIFAPVLEKNRRMQFREVTPETELVEAGMGLLEPSEGETVTARMLDLVITPVVAFDSKNNRIGMGGGYFDRTFSFVRHRTEWSRPRLIGIAYACQEVAEIPPNPWDIRVFRVVSD